jgi:hypothetical protein
MTQKSHMTKSTCLLACLLLACLLLTACTAAPTGTTAPIAAPTVTGITTVDETSASDTTASEPTAPTNDTQPATPAAALELVSGPLWVTITAPQDGSIHPETTVEVVGTAAEGTVLTINDEILYLETGGDFTVTLGLLQGPNTIEIIASDLEGSELTGTLIIFHEPTQE